MQNALVEYIGVYLDTNNSRNWKREIREYFLYRYEATNHLKNVTRHEPVLLLKVPIGHLNSSLYLVPAGQYIPMGQTVVELSKITISMVLSQKYPAGQILHVHCVV